MTGADSTVCRARWPRGLPTLACVISANRAGARRVEAERDQRFVGVGVEADAGVGQAVAGEFHPIVDRKLRPPRPSAASRPAAAGPRPRCPPACGSSSWRSSREGRGCGRDPAPPAVGPGLRYRTDALDRGLRDAHLVDARADDLEALLHRGVRPVDEAGLVRPTTTVPPEPSKERSDARRAPPCAPACRVPSARPAARPATAGRSSPCRRRGGAWRLRFPPRAARGGVLEQRLQPLLHEVGLVDLQDKMGAAEGRGRARPCLRHPRGSAARVEGESTFGRAVRMPRSTMAA